MPMTMLKDKSREVLGLQFVLDSMEFMSTAGRRRMLEQPWLTATDDLNREQEAVEAVGMVLGDASQTRSVNTLRHQLMQLHDIRSTLLHIEHRTQLDEVELFEVKNLSHIGGIARRAVDELGLGGLFVLPDCHEVFDMLDPDATGVPTFYVYDSYDSRLTPLRRQMKTADEEAKADLFAQHEQVQQEVIALLSERLVPHAGVLHGLLDMMAYIDTVMARAVLAQQWGLTRPSTEGCYLHGLFNPRLRQHNQEAGLRYHAVDIDLTEGVTIVTGANMAGKTVLLKSVGLAQLMYQFGFPLPAQEGCLPVVDDVAFCIGDEQNEMNGLSSYAAEITRVSEVLCRCHNERLMVLIDEPARTTNPVEGKALVQAIATLLSSRSSITMITTHYSQLGVKCRRLRVKGFMEDMVDAPLTPQNINRYIDYSLMVDADEEVPREALRIAEMLQCHPDLVSTAKAFL